MKSFAIASVIAAGLTAALGIPVAYAGYSRMSPSGCIGLGTSTYYGGTSSGPADWQNTSTTLYSEVDCPIPDTSTNAKSSITSIAVDAYVKENLYLEAYACVTSYTGGAAVCDGVFDCTDASANGYCSASSGTLGATSVWHSATYQYDYPFVSVNIPYESGGVTSSFNGYNITY